MPLPPPSPSTMVASVVVEELQEQLLASEELMRREEALTMQQEGAKISQKALVKVRADLDAERAKAKATQQGYLNKMEAHITHSMYSLSLDKMLGEKKVELNGRERDLDLREAALVEAQL
jgi:hypothetical protein